MKRGLLSFLQSTLSSNTDSLYNNVVGFKDVTDGSGASTIIRNVAEQFALSGKSVCIIDTHLCKHSLSALCGCNPEPTVKSMLFYKPGDLIGSYMQPTSIHKDISFVEAIDSTADTLISSWDNPETFIAVLNAIRPLFSIILINLSNELSQINDAAIGHCNILFPVLTPALTCTSNLQNFVAQNYELCMLNQNTKNVIVNKVEPSQANIINSLFNKGNEFSNDLSIVTMLPFSAEIYKASCTGQSLVRTDALTGLTVHSSIREFGAGIQAICDFIYSQNSKSL